MSFKYLLLLKPSLTVSAQTLTTSESHCHTVWPPFQPDNTSFYSVCRIEKGASTIERRELLELDGNASSSGYSTGVMQATRVSGLVA